jgi:hypothetical protein
MIETQKLKDYLERGKMKGKSGGTYFLNSRRMMKMIMMKRN